MKSVRRVERAKSAAGVVAQEIADPVRAGALVARARGLLVLNGVLETAPLREVTALLTALAERRGAGDVAAAYGALFRATAVRGSLPGAVAEAVLLDDNVLSRRAQHASRPEAVPAALLDAVAADLRTLQALVQAGENMPAAVGRLLARNAPLPWPAGGEPDVAGSSQQASGESGEGGESGERRRTARERFLQVRDWGALATEVVDHYAVHGGGIFARYRAFRWVGVEHGGVLPVPQPDAVRPADLIGYEAERALLWRNTAQFLAGYPANNVLLYGDRGTGKSSSVKALLNAGGTGGATPVDHSKTGKEAGEEAGDRQPLGPVDLSEPVDWERLRLIEVPKTRLADFPLIVSSLRGRPQRFVLFVDDLSFEEGETQYKDMKAMLEGGLEARPENVLVYATSNRRHLIREYFADRTSPASNEVHAHDTVQEKLSFADRFGISITFPTPDQTAYLAIVEGLARQRGLRIEPAALRSRAIEWAAWHNGRSGRTARQFVDHLEGELRMKNEERRTGSGGADHGGEGRGVLSS